MILHLQARSSATKGSRDPIFFMHLNIRAHNIGLLLLYQGYPVQDLQLKPSIIKNVPLVVAESRAMSYSLPFLLPS